MMLLIPKRWTIEKMKIFNTFLQDKLICELKVIKWYGVV